MSESNKETKNRAMRTAMIKKYAFRTLILIILAGGIALAIQAANRPGKYDEFATCVKDSGAKFYGAFWCPHCAAQKKAFEGSQKKLPYIECSTPDAKGQVQACNDAGIQSYPTWEFADGRRIEGEMSLEDIAAKTMCTLPGAEAVATGV